MPRRRFKANMQMAKSIDEEPAANLINLFFLLKPFPCCYFFLYGMNVRDGGELGLSASTQHSIESISFVTDKSIQLLYTTCCPYRRKRLKSCSSRPI